MRRYLRSRRGLVDQSDLGVGGNPQHLAGKNAIDIVVDESVFVGALDGQHHLLHADIIRRAYLLGNLVQRVTGLDDIATLGSRTLDSCSLGSRSHGVLNAVADRRIRGGDIVVGVEHRQVEQ